MFAYATNPAAAYRKASVDTSVLSANPHQLVALLFDGLLQSLHTARGALARADTATKGQQIGRAVRILEEGLKAGLDMQRGGEVAATLHALYDYCIGRLTYANLNNQVAALDEVVGLIDTVADGWRQIAPQSAAVPARDARPPQVVAVPRRAPTIGAAAYLMGA